MRTSKNIAGFSLLEMIGVMAVMAIMAGALAPSIFQMMESGYETAEAQSMSSLGASLQGYVLRNKQIPAAAEWVNEIADFAGLVPARVAQNDKRFNRKIYFAPRFFADSRAAFTGYTQDVGLSERPFSPRIMIVSSLSGEVTASLDRQTYFDAVWEQTGTPRIVESKSVVIERLNLAPHFKRVVLSNSSTNQTGYALEDGVEGSIAAASGVSDGQRTLYLIADSIIKLRGAPYPGQPVLRQHLVKGDISFRYQEDGGVWSWHD